jgi:hypothetical protein
MVFVVWAVGSFAAAAGWFFGIDIRKEIKVARPARIGRMCVGSGVASEMCQLGFRKVNQFK